MRRSRIESRKMDNAIIDLFKEFPEAKLVANRYRTIRRLLGERYPVIRDVSKEMMCDILFDAISFDRKLRLFTEGEEKELKQQLSEEFQATELGLPT